MVRRGRVLNKPKGEGFAARSWLENDGDGATQEQAFARAGFDGVKGQLVFLVEGQRFVHLSGRGAADRLDEVCEAGVVVILAGESEIGDPPCQVIDRQVTKQLGAIAVSVQAEELVLLGAKQVAGDRLWHRSNGKRDRFSGP